MIIYNKTLWGIPLLTRVYGSALPRSIAPALVSGLVTALLLLLGDRVQHLWGHPYAYQPFVLIVSFVLTFRSNYAYQRHWEAYTQVQSMTARWLDAAVQIIMFDRHPQSPEGSSRGSQEQHSKAASLAVPSGHHQFVAELIHLISLLHGTSCAALRRDPDVRNLTRHCRLSEAPPMDPALLRSSLPGSPRAAAAAEAAEAAAEAADGGAAAPAVSGSTGGSWSRWPRARSREGLPFGSEPSIVGAANWRDIFMLRGSSNTIRKYNAAQPLAIIGGVSPQELAALGCKGQHGYCGSDEEGRAHAADDAFYFDSAFGSNRAAGGWSPHSPSGQEPKQRSGGSLWGALRHRQQQQQQQQAQPQRLSPVRSQSYSEGLASLGRSTAGPATGSSSFRSTISSYFDVRTLSSKLPSFAQPRFGSATPAAAAAAGAGQARPAGLKRSPSRRFRISLNHTCCPAHLPYMDRPFMLLAWLYDLLLQRQAAGGLRVPAPVLARVYTCLSDGIHAFEQCRKLADTPFPFPWAQFVLVMLVLFTFTLPLLVLAYVQDSGLAVVLTVLTVSTYWTVNEVARDVEDAFIMEPNNMPLANGQYHFNELLLTLSMAERPASGVVPVMLPMPQAVAAGSTPGGGASTPLSWARTATATAGLWMGEQGSRPSPPADIDTAVAATAAGRQAAAAAAASRECTAAAPAVDGGRDAWPAVAQQQQSHGGVQQGKAATDTDAPSSGRPGCVRSSPEAGGRAVSDPGVLTVAHDGNAAGCPACCAVMLGAAVACASDDCTSAKDGSACGGSVTDATRSAGAAAARRRRSSSSPPGGGLGLQQPLQAAHGSTKQAGDSAQSIWQQCKSNGCCDSMV